jgi:hypothetical protein
MDEYQNGDGARSIPSRLWIGRASERADIRFAQQNPRMRRIAWPCHRADVDDASQVGALLDQIDGPIASFIADGAYHQETVYAAVAARHPEAQVVVPPRATAVLSSQNTPTQRDRHLQAIATHGRMPWQKSSGYNMRAKVEASLCDASRSEGRRLRRRPSCAETDRSRQHPAETAHHRLLVWPDRTGGRWANWLCS